MSRLWIFILGHFVVGHIMRCTDKMLADKMSVDKILVDKTPVKIARVGGTKCWPFYGTGRAKCEYYQNTLYMILMIKQTEKDSSRKKASVKTCRRKYFSIKSL